MSSSTAPQFPLAALNAKPIPGQVRVVLVATPSTSGALIFTIGVDLFGRPSG